MRTLLILVGLTVFSAFALGKGAETETEKANLLFAEIFQQKVDRSPIFQTSIGVKTDYDRWDDMSEAFAQQEQRLRKANLSKIQALDKSKLDKDALLSVRILEDDLQRDIDFFKWRYHNYPFNQMWGMHTYVVSLLMNEHKVESVKDAEDYISRLNAIPKLFDQLLEAQNVSAKKGILAPKIIFPKVIASSENIIRGAPFNEGDDSILYGDIKSKIAALEVDDKKKARLLKSAEKALTKKVGPAYKKLIAAMQKLEVSADERAGAWKFPEGEAYYQAALERTTTTKLNAEEIHKIGLQEVARIHEEIRAIMRKVKFEGNLQDFFKFIRNDDRFYFADTEEGRNAYLDEASRLVSEIKTYLPELFISQPAADLLVKAVEPYREKSAGMAFYQAGTPDGSRPGIFYANLSDMREITSYEIAALVYHEGLPGHHMQISIARELKDIPEFRKYSRFTAYIEGWGLYSELLPKEIGLYQDPYSDFGRLNMELWRACRLVVDTGLHHYKWTRQQAIDYLLENTPAADVRAERSIDRYIVIPSQATAYKVGMMKFVELREQARAKLGDKFDIREFHEQVLAAGPLPLTILDDQIQAWVASKL